MRRAARFFARIISTREWGLASPPSRTPRIPLRRAAAARLPAPVRRLVLLARAGRQDRLAAGGEGVFVARAKFPAPRANWSSTLRQRHLVVPLNFAAASQQARDRVGWDGLAVVEALAQLAAKRA